MLILDITGGPELQILETGDTICYVVPIAGPGVSAISKPSSYYFILFHLK
jgi:hypothetical protein